MRFWNNMAHAIRNTRAAFAAAGVLGVLGVLLYAQCSAPEVVRREVIFAPVVEVEPDREGAQWVRVLVDTPLDGPVRLLWMQGSEPLWAGSEAPLVVTEYADGRRDYHLIQRR